MTALSQDDSSERLQGGQGSSSGTRKAPRLHAGFWCFCCSLRDSAFGYKIFQTQCWAIYASLGPSFARMMSQPLSGSVCTSLLLLRPSAQKPNTLQHSLFPGRDTIRRDVKGAGRQPALPSPGSLSPKSCIPENLLCTRHWHYFQSFHIHLI